MVTAGRRSFLCDEVREILLRAIKRNHSRTAGDLIDVVRGRVDASDRMVYRVLSRLSDEGRVSRVGKRMSPDSGYVLGGVPNVANAWRAIGVCMLRGFRTIEELSEYIAV